MVAALVVGNLQVVVGILVVVVGEVNKAVVALLGFVGTREAADCDLVAVVNAGHHSSA